MMLVICLCVLTIMTLSIPSYDRMCGLKPAQALCSFQSLNVLSAVQFLYFYVGLSHVFTPPMLVWLAQEDIILC